MTRAPLLVALLLVAVASGASAASTSMPDASDPLDVDDCRAAGTSCLNNVARVRASQGAGTSCTVDEGKVVCSSSSG